MHPTFCVLLMIPTQRRLSFWFGDRKMKTLVLWFTWFESNILLSHVLLFHCATCNVFLLCGPSARLMLLDCKMSSLWVTVTVTVPCMSLRTTTLMRCFMFPMTFGPPGVHYGRRPIRSLISCSKMTPTLLTLLARCFSCGKETIGWRLGGGTLTSITPWHKDWHISVDFIVVDSTNYTALFLNAMNNINCWVFIFWFFVLFVLYVILLLFLSYLFFVGPRSMTMSRTTFPPSYFAFEYLEKWSLRSSRTSFPWPTTKCTSPKCIRTLLGIPLSWTTLSNSCTR